MPVNPNPATYQDLVGNVDAYAGILADDNTAVLAAAKTLSDVNTKQADDTKLSDAATAALGAAISSLDPKVAVGVCRTNADGSFTAFENGGNGTYTAKTLLPLTMPLVVPTGEPGPPPPPVV
jgi:hypothetical protein